MLRQSHFFSLINIIFLYCTQEKLFPEALSFNPLKNNKDSALRLSRRDLITIPIGVGSAVIYGKLLSNAFEKLSRGDLVYPDAHERRVRSTITTAVIGSIPPDMRNKKEDESNEGLVRSLRILEVGVGKGCRVIQRDLYKDAFSEATTISQGILKIELTGVDIVSPTTAVLERSKDMLMRTGVENGAEISFEFVQGSVTSGLNFTDGFFDCVICSLTLCSVDDQIVALNEIKRVLKKDGGTFGYIEHVAVSPDEPFRILEFQQKSFNSLQILLADNCHLNRLTEDNISIVFDISEGRNINAKSIKLMGERFLVDDMWPISCQTCGVIRQLQ
mmetsp:Transcript_24915/g.28506  ORF Transcript_24915/g.28506 Transcript_24915/m.28506 type:complete len:331 (-) Transcript_24915:1425-2417(-)